MVLILAGNMLRTHLGKYGLKKILFVTALDLSIAVNRSNNRDCSLCAHLFELSSNLSTMGWKSDPRAPSPQLIPRPPPTFHDTRPEQAAAEQEIARQNAAALDDQVPVIPRLTQLQPPADRRDRPDSLYTPKADLALPDLVPAAKKLNNATRYQKQKPYR